MNSAGADKVFKTGLNNCNTDKQAENSIYGLEFREDKK